MAPGALAAATVDLLLVTPDSYFAAITPEGASAALRRPVRECADLLRLTPTDLRALGAVDAVVDGPAAIPGMLAALCAAPGDRLARRRARWSAPLPYGL